MGFSWRASFLSANPKWRDFTQRITRVLLTRKAQMQRTLDNCENGENKDLHHVRIFHLKQESHQYAGLYPSR